MFIPCTCRTRIPHRVNWQLTAPAETTTADAQCYVDVGYVTEDDAYVRSPKKVTIIVNIKNHLVGISLSLPFRLLLLLISFSLFFFFFFWGGGEGGGAGVIFCPSSSILSPFHLSYNI